MTQPTITLQRGEYATWRFPMIQNGVAVNLASASQVSFVARTSVPAGTVVSDADAVLSKTLADDILIYDAAGGLLDVTFNDTDTKALELEAGQLQLYWGVKIQFEGEAGPRPCGSGILIINFDTVRAL